VFLGTACHSPRVLSRRMLNCAGWYCNASALKIAQIHLWNVDQYCFGGCGMSGHSLSNPACQSPVSIPSGIVDPSGLVRSAIVITLRYSLTAFVYFSCPLVIPEILMNRSIIALSHCRWSDGTHVCSNQIVSSMPDSLRLISHR